ncbi:hypothetical protein [Microbacterium sp.]|uniref:hypothetical protein n=1 Tax=Microbacterium sp. TaxID=51671 RepID=UPI002810C7E7|nr:hypothetical protein [Microbacterium sp.]
MIRNLARRLLLPAALGALLATGAAAPAAASGLGDGGLSADLTASHGEGDHCSVNIDTGVRVCAATASELADAVYEATGEVLVYGTASRTGSTTDARMAAAAATYALGTIYSYPNYGGRSYTATSSYSCTQGLAFTFSDLGAIGWNDDIDSFKSYSGCKTKLWEHPGFSGATYGYYSYDSDLGSWRNRASAIRWD